MGDVNKQMLAITETSANEEQDVDQPRQPRNLQDLLRYSLQASSAMPNPIIPGLGPPRFRHEHDRRFLSDFVSSISIDVTKVLQISLTTLQGDFSPGDSPTKYEDALNDILDLVDNIDMANDCFKLGGFDMCTRWLEIGTPGIKWRAASVIAECCQNNPYCQSVALQAGLLKKLMDISQNDSNEKVQVKSFHAVSCIVRNNQSGFLTFLSLNGHKFILHCLKSPSFRLKTKASFFTSVTADKEPMFKEQLWDIGVTKELAQLVCTSRETNIIKDVGCFEQCLSALLCLVKDSKKNLGDKEYVVKNLEELFKLLEANPSYSECVDILKSLLEAITSK